MFESFYEENTTQDLNGKPEQGGHQDKTVHIPKEDAKRKQQERRYGKPYPEYKVLIKTLIDEFFAEKVVCSPKEGRKKGKQYTKH